LLFTNANLDFVLPKKFRVLIDTALFAQINYSVAIMCIASYT